MPSAIVVTPGDASANSFSSRAFANDYHGDRVHATTWTNASDDTKDAALIMATRIIGQQFIWDGQQTYPGIQGLEFPRVGLFDSDEPNARPLDSTKIPIQLANGTAEFARLLIKSDTTVASGTAGGAITSIKAGSVKLDYAEGVVAHVDLIPTSVRYSVPRHWWLSIRSRAGATVPLIRT